MIKKIKRKLLERKIPNLVNAYKSDNRIKYKKEYSWFQLREIYKGISEGLPVSEVAQYADSKNDWTTMNDMRHLLLSRHSYYSGTSEWA